MIDVYDNLIETGFLASLKRDIVLEASRDLEYLAHIRGRFESASTAAAKVATACTVRITQELIATGVCSLSTWGKGDHDFEVVEKSADELFEMVDKTLLQEGMAFAYFLVTTKRGEDWVERYNKLVNEL